MINNYLEEIKFSGKMIENLISILNQINIRNGSYFENILPKQDVTGYCVNADISIFLINDNYKSQILCVFLQHNKLLQPLDAI